MQMYFCIVNKALIKKKLIIIIIIIIIIITMRHENANG